MRGMDLISKAMKKVEQTDELLLKHQRQQKEKLSDNEIIKALQCCITPAPLRCNKCTHLGNSFSCRSTDLKKDVLDLINSQKAEIEQWKEEANRYQSLWCEAVSDVQTTRTEAIKEFAMMLKCGVPQETGVIRCADVDNLVKEMAGDTE